MRAIKYQSYGEAEVLELQSTEKPKPKKNEVLIKNYASTVTAADIMMRVGKPFIGRLYLGLSKPKRPVLGFEFAGEVIEIGDAVTLFKIGDKVFGGTTTLGCYAEFLAVSENDVILTMPENITFQEAAPVSGSAITVMNFLKGLGKIQSGQKVLINGASGALGTYAVQIAKHMGANVTGVCSTKNLEIVKSLGADTVIDYSKVDFTKNGEQYDIIFDTIGKRSFSECKSSLSPNGVYLSSIMSFSLLLQIIWTSIFGSKKAKTSSTGLLPVKERLGHFLEIKSLLKNANIKTVVSRTYPLSQIVDAHKHVESGHKVGNVVVSI